jgi:hypothetical protein
MTQWRTDVEDPFLCDQEPDTSATGRMNFRVTRVLVRSSACDVAGAQSSSDG